MRRLLLLLPAVGVLHAWQAPPPVLPDLRPFGKYLVATCTISGVCEAGLPRADPRTQQAITIKHVGCAAGSTTCPDPVYPLASSHDFFISGMSDSGLPVGQRVISGHVTPLTGGGGVQQYHLTGPGTVVIEATQPGDADHYAPATPVQIRLEAPAEAGSDDGSCSSLFQPNAAVQVPRQIDAASVISLIGSPTPFVLAAQGGSIFIYSTRLPNTRGETATLGRIIEQIGALARQTPGDLGVTAAGKPFQVELEIAHAASLGDPAARISALNYSGFTVQDISDKKVRITAPKQPECSVWKSFLSGIRRLEWQGIPEPFEMKLFYLSAPDAASAFSALAGSVSAAPASAPAAPSTSGGASPSGTANSTIAVTQPPGSFIDIKSDTTPCVIAGLTMSNASACNGSSGGSASGGGASAAPAATGITAPKPPPGMAYMNVASGTNELALSDLLVFNNTYAGDDAQILERKRVLAMLDLPRPQMIVNAWVMQNSTANRTAMGKFNSTVKELVAEYDKQIDFVAVKGWEALKQAMKNPDYFNRRFYHYISDQFVVDNYSDAKPSGPQDAAQNFLDQTTVKLADNPTQLTNVFGLCQSKQYCLGYMTLFQPLMPHFTDFLLTIIAAAKPNQELSNAIGKVQVLENPILNETDCDTAIAANGSTAELRDRCRAIWTNLGLDSTSGRSSCAETDYRDILSSLVTLPSAGYETAPRVYLLCLQQASDQYLKRFAGLVRASVADFLFHYKLSQQYPHEFYPYELSQSADDLNTALAPIIDAFNRDIIAYQTFLRADLQYQVERLNRDSDERCCIKRLFGLDKPSFFNDGLITVRTISGQPTTVNTTSQSFLDTSSAPTLAALANNIASAGSSSSTGKSPIAGVLGSAQPSAALLTGVLNSYQSSSAQIGRSLNLTVTPRSLSKASSAEINVTLNADESSGGIIYSGGPTGGDSPNTSRVASHETTTRIRVDSVRLFGLSSLVSVVERSRSKFPLLPPFVELPYIGTLVGIPIPAAKEYHNSTAIMSAMVVPTAADIAYGLSFSFDLLVDGTDGKGNTCSYITGSAGPDVGPCRFRRANSLYDFHHAPIFKYHSVMLNCLSTEPTESTVNPLAAANAPTPYTGIASLTGPPVPGACDALTFDRVPH
jgi:hypothetical protein